MKQNMLTTIDNPFDPFTQFTDWYAYDERKGYHTLSYLSRIVITSDELSEADQAAAIEQAIDDIINDDPLKMYRKVQYQG